MSQWHFFLRSIQIEISIQLKLIESDKRFRRSRIQQHILENVWSTET